MTGKLLPQAQGYRSNAELARDIADPRYSTDRPTVQTSKLQSRSQQPALINVRSSFGTHNA